MSQVKTQLNQNEGVGFIAHKQAQKLVVSENDDNVILKSSEHSSLKSSKENSSSNCSFHFIIEIIK